MAGLTRYPYPDAQTAHDLFANRLALFTSPEDVEAALGTCIVVDLRPKASYQAGAVPTAVHMTKVTRETAPGIVGQDIIVVYDDGFSTRAEQAAVTWAALGHKVKVMVGGYAAWETAGYATQ